MFKKWASIENSYRDKHITWFVDKYPELVDEPFIITEKIHGSNFQWYIQPNESIMAGSRNNFLNVNDSFQGASIVALYDANIELLTDLQIISNNTGETYRLFGELFGKGIQKGVDYGDVKQLLYFGLMVDDVVVSYEEFESIVGYTYRVPEVAICDGLVDALEYSSKFNSKVLLKDNNICEGIVIQPYQTHFLDGNGSPFILKKKNDEFKEKSDAKKVVVLDTEVQRLNLEFRSYINDNRLQSVFSKQGEIEAPNQIGTYIKLVLEDAKEDFVKDFPEMKQMDGKKQRQVYNVGSVIAIMLKGYL